MASVARPNSTWTDACHGIIQFCEGSIDSTAGRRQEDYEAVQHTSSVQENVPRVEAVEASTTRKC